jgi:putative restriction endonuclease
MAQLVEAMATVSGLQRDALEWFAAHTGQTVAWATLQEHANHGARLVNQAKGIYKPRYTDYALSVRQTLGGTYADKEVIRRPDGTWVYSYFQENADPSQRDREATNRGLMLCMRDGVPVAVLLQTKLKPGAEYLVLGLATVTEWKDGYFILEGFSPAGDLSRSNEREDAAHERARVLTNDPTREDFRPSEIVDARERQIAEVVRRRGQAKFRSSLVSAYSGKCCATGCDALEALEAAHISPYRGEHSNHPQNGLLLRADLHNLFDLGLVSVDPIGMTWVISPSLQSSMYSDLMGRPLSLPTEKALRPSADALGAHLVWAPSNSSRA